MKNLIYFVNLFVSPIVVSFTLYAIVYINTGKIDNVSIAIGILAFAFYFPSKISFDQTLLEAANNIFIKWSGVVLLMLIVGYSTNYIETTDVNILLTWIISVPFMLTAIDGLARYIAYRLYDKLNIKSAVIVGCSSVGLALGDNLKKNKLHGINLVGYFDARSLDRIDIQANKYLGNISDVAKYVNDHAIQYIYICLPTSDQRRINKLLNDLKDTTASVFYIPDIFTTDLIQKKIGHIDNIPIIPIYETPFIGSHELQKRIIDIVLSFCILLLFSPILLLAAIGVRQSSPGPIIFVQKRYGLDGKSIDVYKFRTMTVTENGNNVYKQVEKNDARVTPFGAFLRKTSLDEFPQFINVLQGRMSIVGPRPHVVAVNESYRKIIPGYMLRHKIKPGITGLAQINGFRGGDDLEHMKGRITYDLEYLRRWSIPNDLLIILKTIVMLTVGDKKAY